MIFSKLFASKANWQHQDPSVRVSCIEQELQLNEAQDEQIIRQLASEDESALVRRAALLKLNDYSLWQQALTNDSASSIRRVAEQKIVEHIASDDTQLSIEKRIEFGEQLNKALAEQVLNQTNSIDLILALFSKLDKPHLLVSIAQQKNQLALWQYIIDNNSDIDSLEKLAKKVNLESASTLLNNKITALKEAEQAPIKITKDAQLNLSKLLALKDVTDYGVVLSKRAELEKEWQVLSEQFQLLSEESAQTFNEKYVTINATLDKVFIAKAEQYQQAQIAAKVAQQQQDQQQDFEQFLSSTTQAISEAIFENASLDEQQLLNDIAEFERLVKASVLSEQAVKSLLVQSQELANKLSKVNEIAASVANATQLIARMSQQTPPVSQSELSDKQGIFKSWLRDWQENMRQASGVLPESIIAAHKEVKTAWLAALAPLEKEQEQLLRQTQRKVSDLKRLLASGKYNAAFGVFNKFKRAYNELTEELQRKLHRDFEHLSEKMAELSDWEHYIATPRKKELLQEIKALAETPLDNPNEQADKVKWYRKTWNTLGHADEEVDRELNQAFNQACEQAFAPCRLFYAEQEKIRDAHLATRKELIEHLKLLTEQLSSKDIDFKTIESSFNKLNQQWRNAGDVDRKVYRNINQEYQTLSKPVRMAINHYHDDNEKAKQALIDEAQSLASHMDDEQAVFDAVNRVKRLQEQWKTVGYAGAKKENRLWQQFRAINDQIFGQRQQVQSKHKQESAEQLSSVKATLEALNAKLTAETTTPSNIKALQSEAQQLKQQLLGESHPNKTALGQVSQFVSQCQSKLELLLAQSSKKDWQQVFALFEQIAQESLTRQACEDTAAYESLSKASKRKVLDHLSEQNAENRLALTITLEIIAGVESPAQDQAQRRTIQVELMQQKMNSGELTSAEDKLWSWLNDGQLTAEDLLLIDRAKRIFC
ncbi:DUF349 domain-containing protein [Thalassotalea euphylliae]|uniref:DUF349 domain-containing protein n=1 Tax=Thalassotalea euphylliae TaxID=1655234 RepID=A0A3E0TZ00_9GAMM|nr:DUF349 domain-containing protein [Thalassotalea euphylliae]REL29627.1 DUF349 domain-containing protein [Thalassotalea euphylliae]